MILIERIILTFVSIGIQKRNFDKNPVSENFFAIETLFRPFGVFITAIETNHRQPLADRDETPATSINQLVNLCFRRKAM